MTASHAPASPSRQIDRWDALVERYGRWVIRWRWAVLIATVALALVAAAGSQYLGFSTSYRVFFSAENPQLAALDALQAKFTKDDGFLLVLKPKSGPLFTPERLAAIRSLSEEAWKVPFATRVDSIANFQHSSADGDDLLVRDLVPIDEVISTAQALAVRDIALKEPLLKQRLISADGQTTGINIVLTLPEKALDEVPTAMAYVRQMVDEFSAKNPDFQVAITGMTALNNAFTEASMQDMSTLVPLMYGVLVLVMDRAVQPVSLPCAVRSARLLQHPVVGHGPVTLGPQHLRPAGCRQPVWPRLFSLRRPGVQHSAGEPVRHRDLDAAGTRRPLPGGPALLHPGCPPRPLCGCRSERSRRTPWV